MADAPTQSVPSTRALTGSYTRAMVWYLALVLALWLLGIEGIYGHPTPFYALYQPAFQSLFVPAFVVALIGITSIYWAPRHRWLKLAAWLCLPLLTLPFLHQQAASEGVSFQIVLYRNLRLLPPHILCFATCTVFLLLLHSMLQNMNWFRGGMDRWEIRRFLVGIVLFSILFACAVAAIRGGFHGISQAYERTAYEYIGDIGKTASIRALFTRYLDVHEFLSMHAKVHPPGPIVVLWLLSYLVGQGALALSLATVVVGALAVVPLFYWTRDLLGPRPAVVACALYSVVPSVVLFTATSADILFTPFTIATLCWFDRALQRNAWRYALAAGIGFACMSLLKFSLLAFGLYFAFAGLAVLRRRFWVVVKVALLMLAAFLAVHVLLWLWTGFEYMATLEAAKAQFDADQHHLDLSTPRLDAWIYRILNPLCWFFFAGIPVSLLFFRQLFMTRSVPAAAPTGAPVLPSTPARSVIFALMLFALNVLYLARGEGERSALYLFPFLVIPAAQYLDTVIVQARSLNPLLATLAFMGFQCWLIESYLYTYW